MEQKSPYRKLSQEEINDISSRILYEDNHYLILNKRSGEIVQGDKTNDEPLSETLKAFIANRDNKKGNVFMGVAHRLDRPVSGAVLFAKTSKGLERVNELIRSGALHKTYWALTQKPDYQITTGEQIELRDFIRRDEKANKSFIFKGKGTPPKECKEAVLRYRVLKQTDNYLLTEVELLTGRHHQIRCQLSNVGMPIKGDLKYGAKRSNRDGSISLHARKLELVHPIGVKDAKGNPTDNQKKICVEAPLMGEMQHIVND